MSFFFLADLAIPITFGICGVVICLVILTVLLLVFIKGRGDHGTYCSQETIQVIFSDDFEQPTKDN